ARPRRVVIVPDMPKTRSGKIMRRLLGAISNNEEASDISTLANPEIVNEIRKMKSYSRTRDSENGVRKATGGGHHKFVARDRCPAPWSLPPASRSMVPNVDFFALRVDFGFNVGLEGSPEDFSVSIGTGT